MLLTLSGDINLNAWPVYWHQIKDHKFEVYTIQGLHFIHLNVNSLPTNIEELQYIAKNSTRVVVDMSEIKLDETVYDSEITIDGYNQFQVTEIEGVERCLLC